MKRQNPNRTKNILLVYGIVGIALVLVYFTASVDKKKEAKPDAFNQQNNTEIPLVIVRQDSVMQLFRYFCEDNTSKFRVDSGANSTIAFFLDRYSSTPSILFCNNNELPGMSSPGFRMMVHQNGDVDVVFRREKKGSTWFVALPTDILCGLMKFHPDIK